MCVKRVHLARRARRDPVRRGAALWLSALAAWRVAVAAAHASLPEQCAELAARYDPHYEERELRSVGTPLVVRGGGAGGGGGGGAADGAEAAAAALLLVGLRYGLNYEATFTLRELDSCTANVTQLSVTSATSATSATPHQRCGGEASVPLRASVLVRTQLRMPLRAVLSERPAEQRCASIATLALDDEATMSSCDFLTLRDFKKLMDINVEMLPRCYYSARACAPARFPAGASNLALLAAPADWLTLHYIQQYICKENLPVNLLRFTNESCFRSTLEQLHKLNISFVLFDEHFVNNTYATELVPVALTGSERSDRCASRGADRVVEFADDMQGALRAGVHLSPVVEVVNSFCPSLRHLREIVTDRPTDERLIEVAACRWAVQNRDAFESLIPKVNNKFGLYFYSCTRDPMNAEYIKTIHAIRTSVGHDYSFTMSEVKVECHDRHNMSREFTDMIQRKNVFIMGVVVWSSSEGAAELAAAAGRARVPLALVGPVAADTPVGRSASAVDGTLDGLAAVYRVVLTDCRWTRLAILSDGSSYSKSFRKSILRGVEFVHIEITITSEATTVWNALRSLRAVDARVVLVNADSETAADILRSAITLRMTPPRYAWIVREWNPDSEHAGPEWSSMTHLSLGTSWRGAAGGADGVASEGQVEASARLRALWRGRAWPALAASLANAMLLLYHSFTRNTSRIQGTLRVPGVEKELFFYNGSVETVQVYLERWRGTSRVVLAVWNVRRGRHELLRSGESWCDARTRDRPACAFPAASGAFLRTCYDVQMYTLLVVLALLPVVFVVARRARLKRLLVRDLNLLAQISERKCLPPIVHGDLLCMHKKIGTGNFGSVYLATLRQSTEKTTLVAAKALRDDSGKEEYLQEAGILQLLDHENVVKFVGICVSNGSLLILMEYAHHGDLLEYLRARRHLAVGECVREEGEGVHVSAEQLTRLAREAAAALVHLARTGLVHRDVRAANCLIDERRTLKLADFGLARRLCDNMEYTSIRRAMFPVLWMAPESLSRGTFSTASDVWSLGVLCLELVTLGSRPYGACAPHQVLAYVRLGGRPPLPLDASPETISVVSSCWEHDAADRATAADVASYLARQPQALRPALLPAPDPLPEHCVN